MRIGKAQAIGIRRVCALMAALALVFVGLMGATPAIAETDGMLRVKLTRLGAPTEVAFTADCDYYLASDPTVRIAAGEAVKVTAGGGALTMTCGSDVRTLGETVRLMRAESGNRGLRFTSPELSNRFCGDLGLSASGGVITAILNIYVENYLYGVVGYVMPPSAGLEALKAMAVAARTAALRKRSTRRDAVYDLTDTGDLVFKGYNDTADYANVVRAVDDTRGGVLYYGGALAQCASCPSNGGQTEASKNAGGAALNYSVVRDDPYDYESRSAAIRTASVNKDLTGVAEALREALMEGTRDQLRTAQSFRVLGVESITACDSRFPAPSRLYKSLTFKLAVTGVGADGEERTGTVSVSIPTYGGFEDWYDLSINPEDNETVWVVETQKSFDISFRRFGSGVGLSQRGAQVMAEKGMRVSDILAFYYPGVEGKRLSLTDTTRDNRSPEPERRVLATARLTDRTDLLDAADDTGEVAATLAAGAVVNIYGARGDWAAVGSGGRYGYIRVDGLESVSLAGAASGEAVYGRAEAAADVYGLPSEEARTLGTLPAGESVRVLAWTDAWRAVSVDGRTGFVPARYVALDEAQPAAAPTDDPDAFVPAPDGVTARLKQDAPLFDAPNALSSTLETLKQGDTVQVLAYSRDWARVRTHRGREGCLRLESITALEGGDSSSEVEGGPIVKVRGKKYMFVTAGSASAYLTWSDDSEPLQTLYYGERVRVGAYNSLWACVRVGDITGYVRMEALSNDKPAAIEGGNITRAASGLMAVARSEVPVYDSARGEKQLMTLSQGQRVSVDAYNAAWALVRVDGVVGYVRLDMLERAGS